MHQSFHPCNLITRSYHIHVVTSNNSVHSSNQGSHPSLIEFGPIRHTRPLNRVAYDLLGESYSVLVTTGTATVGTPLSRPRYHDLAEGFPQQVYLVPRTE